MVEGEVRIMYAGRGTELDETFREFMETLGYEEWARGYGMGDRELCFLPKEESPYPKEASHPVAPTHASERARATSAEEAE